mgnify:FL=1
MFFLSCLMFAFSVNIDAFLVGVSYGIRQIHIPLLQNLAISFISLLGTLLSLFLGRKMLSLLPAALGDYLGSGILLLLGGFYIAKSLFFPKNDLHAEELQKTLSPKETLLLGAALSANNMGIGIGASILGFALLPAAAITFITAVLFLFAGNRLGNISLLRISKRYADTLSGGMLMLLGVLALFY